MTPHNSGGFNRWFDPWQKQFVFPYGHPGYIAGWCMELTYFAAYQATEQKAATGDATLGFSG
jgi:hypothetical protein